MEVGFLVSTQKATNHPPERLCCLFQVRSQRQVEVSVSQSVATAKNLKPRRGQKQKETNDSAPRAA